MSSELPPGESSFSPPSKGSRPRLRRSYRATTTVSGLRHSEMETISVRLGRVSKFPWASLWVTVATLCAGGLVGGLVALIPFVAANPSHTAKLYYFIVLGAVALACVLSVGAAWTTHHERSESIAEIKADYDKYILETYEWESSDEGQRSAVTTQSARELGEDG